MTVTLAPQIIASLDHLAGLAEADNEQKLIELIGATSEERLRSLLIASVIRFNVRRNSPDETDRQRRDLRESLSRKMLSKVSDLQEEAKEITGFGPDVTIDREAKRNQAIGVRQAEGIVRSSTHLV